MDREKLYKLLDIEGPQDFEYFENIAALLECEDHISFDEIWTLLKDVDKDSLVLLINNYFEEVLEFLPGDDADFFLLIDKIRLALMGLARNSDDENILGNLAEEMNKFRIWYSSDSQVICQSILTNAEETYSLRDALVFARLEKIEGPGYFYDFSLCSDYPLDEYIMSFGDVISAEEDEEEN